MDYEKSIKETVKDELKKLSSLTWRQRIGYIWDYYKPLLAAIAVIGLLVSLGVTVWHNIHLNRILSAYLVNCNAYETDQDQIREEFAGYLGGIGSNDQIIVDTSISFDQEEVTEYSMAGQMKITALLAAGEVDLMVLDEKAYQGYYDADVFQELSDVVGEEQLAAWEGYLVEGTDPGDGTKGWFAVDVTDSPVLGKYHSYSAGKAYAVLVPGSENVANGAAFISYLLGV